MKLDIEAFGTSAAIGTHEDDWDFVGSGSSKPPKLHPYPARFIPEIPRRLIRTYPPSDGLVVMDPFCGSGTTLTESQNLGYQSVGVDLNPVATLMSRVATSVVPDGVEAAMEQVLRTARQNPSVEIPSIPRLDHWFRPDVQKALSALASAVAVYGGSARDILRLALSAIVVRVSNQDSDTRYAAVEKNVVGEDVFRNFVRSVMRIVDVLRRRPTRLPTSTVFESDVLQLDPSKLAGKVGLVVTSPPYPNAYEYWLYHKYRIWWLGFDPLAVKEQEIGARAHFFKGRNSHTAENFVVQMRGLMTLIARVLVGGGHACFVVGRSRIHGQTVDNAAIIANAGAEVGLREIARAERVIAATRKSFNLSHANIRTETVLVLRREA